MLWLIGILARFAASADQRKTVLAVSWITMRVSGAKYVKTPLLITVAKPQQAAASTMQAMNCKLRIPINVLGRSFYPLCDNSAATEIGLGSTKKRFLAHRATFTRLIRTGTSNRGPITAAKASPELIPKTPIATAIANSKLLLAAVNERVAVSG
jgi:hypothetical protein